MRASLNAIQLKEDAISILKDLQATAEQNGEIQTEAQKVEMHPVLYFTKLLYGEIRTDNAPVQAAVNVMQRRYKDDLENLDLRNMLYLGAEAHTEEEMNKKVDTFLDSLKVKSKDKIVIGQIAQMKEALRVQNFKPKNSPNRQMLTNITKKAIKENPDRIMSKWSNPLSRWLNKKLGWFTQSTEAYYRLYPKKVPGVIHINIEKQSSHKLRGKSKELEKMPIIPEETTKQLQKAGVELQTTNSVSTSATLLSISRSSSENLKLK